MKISQNWLKQYVKFSLTPQQLTERLTMLGIEVEGHEDLSKKYDKFVVGEVLERAKHPNADRLTFCKVNVGSQVQEIVCGAPNVAAGQKVAVALVGATIPRNQHDPDGKPFVLEKAKIRGVESNGMICSAYELGLGEDADGILVLGKEAKVGTPLAKHLGQSDVIYEIGITPNRADCLSHIGIAREVALLSKKKASLPRIAIKESNERASNHAKIRILDKNRCPRYSARVLRGVKIRPSPGWLQDLLTSVGVRPINNVVDVTNHVMLETGQPLHAFDYEKLAKHTIVVKTAAEGDKFTTLDGKQRTLNAETLLICDSERTVAIAGVMGGENSEISDSTTSILIESACFEPKNIRRTSKFLGLSTEASYRFERGTDVEITTFAADRAAQMIQQLAGAEVLKGVLDEYSKKKKPSPVKLRVSRTNSLLGTTLSRNEIVALLRRIGFQCRTTSKDELRVSAPSFRNDIVEEIDVIEEVARVYGYNKIETKTRAGIDFSASVDSDRFSDELREYFVGSGFSEIVALSLQDSKTAALAGVPTVKVINPVSVEMSDLRTSLVPGALHIVRHNRYRGNKDLRLFEVGNVFSLKEGENLESLDAFSEEERLLLLFTGQYAPPTYGVAARKFDLLDMKGELEAMLVKFSLDKHRFIYYDTHNSLTEPNVGVEINHTYAGYFGKVKKEVADSFDIDDDVFVCELNVEAVGSEWSREKKFESLPRFPSVTRDLAFAVDQELPQRAVEDVIRVAGEPLLKSVVLFDMYVGEQVGEGRKSLAYALEFQASDHTLTDPEVEQVLTRIVRSVHQECSGELRS